MRIGKAASRAIVCALFITLANCGDDDEDDTPSTDGAVEVDACDGEDVSTSGDVIEDVQPLDVTREDHAHDAPEDGPDDVRKDIASEVDADVFAPCPDDMVHVQDWCIDAFEAPNRRDALPLVMYTFLEASAWCEARGKRLCYDDEWTSTCAGPSSYAYPYGDSHRPGVCNDNKRWKTYKQELLNLWPNNLATDSIDSLDKLLALVRSKGAGPTRAANHVWELYQAEPSGSFGDCSAQGKVFDLCGNVEEWTTRRSGSTTGFHGNLKGRYWAETRTCHNSITNHGDRFRFYEIGFRCCRDADRR